MSEFGDVFSRGQAELQVTKAAFADARLGAWATVASSLPVYVDVGSRKIESQVERDGVPIGVLNIDQAILADHILERPVLQVRVVSQSVAAGTPVPAGTTVDLVMATPFELPVGVVTGVHAGLKKVTIADAYSKLVANNPLVNRIVTRAAAGQLGAEDTAAVRTIFADAQIDGVEITDEPGRDVNAAIETLRMLKTFGG